MAALLDISAAVPAHRLRVLSEYVNRFQDEVGMSQRRAVNRVVIALCKSLRARTKSAKPKVEMSKFAKYDGPGPHYITPKSGYYKGVALHRWTKEGFKKHQPYTFIYAAESKRDVRRRHGDIKRHGLAKKSWGWFMKQLFNRSEGDAGNGRLKIDSSMVNMGIRDIETGTNPRIEVMIVNKLDYITQALPDGAVSEAVSAANDMLLHLLKADIEKAKDK